MCGCGDGDFEHMCCVAKIAYSLYCQGHTAFSESTDTNCFSFKDVVETVNIIYKFSKDI